MMDSGARPPPTLTSEETDTEWMQINCFLWDHFFKMQNTPPRIDSVAGERSGNTYYILFLRTSRRWVRNSPWPDRKRISKVDHEKNIQQLPSVVTHFAATRMRTCYHLRLGSRDRNKGSPNRVHQPRGVEGIFRLYTIRVVNCDRITVKLSC